MRPAARRPRFATAGALAIAAAIALVPALAPAPVAAATPGLTVVGATTYEVLPDEGRVAVSVALTATNNLKDTKTKRFFFRTTPLTVQPGTSGFKLAGGSGTPKVSVTSKTETYTNLKIDLGANLAAGKSVELVLTFDIRDPGGAPDRPIRISHSLVSFAAWAYATPDTPGASVVVRFPEGYGVVVGRGPLQGPTPGPTGLEEWSSGPLERPLEFVADMLADRPSDYVEKARTVAMAGGTATVLLRAWPDDPAWEERVGGLVARALPLLERAIGLPWPDHGPLAVHEALVRSTGGFAGLFDPADRRIEIAYAAPDGVVLHELAHAWFNGGLVADRWAAEAFAAYYAGLVALELGIDPAAPELPVEPAPGAIPLNAWGPSGTENVEQEAWGYAASAELARRIVERAGPAAMTAVWVSAASGVGAYQPAGATEPATGPPDWRGLLDLVEDEAGQSFLDLWTTWVARPDDLVAMADRAATLDQYVRSRELAGEWELPPVIRQALRAWHFETARELLVAADGVQARRARLEATAAAAGVTLPPRLRALFEGGGSLSEAATEAEAEQAAVDAIAAAQAARPTEGGAGERLIIGIGLLLSDPEQRLDDAREALAVGNLAAAYAAAQDARSAWSEAAALGRSRIVSVALLVFALIVFAGLIRQQRRRTTAPVT